jgi:hypothetical protein
MCNCYDLSPDPDTNILYDELALPYRIQDPETGCFAIVCNNTEQTAMLLYSSIVDKYITEMFRDNVRSAISQSDIDDMYEFFTKVKFKLLNTVVKEHEGHKLLCFIDVPYYKISY